MEGCRLVNIMLLYRSIYITEHTHTHTSWRARGSSSTPHQNTRCTGTGNTDLGESDIITRIGTIIIIRVLWSTGGLRALASDKPHRELALCVGTKILYLYGCKNNIIYIYILFSAVSAVHTTSERRDNSVLRTACTYLVRRKYARKVSGLYIESCAACVHETTTTTDTMGFCHYFCVIVTFRRAVDSRIPIDDARLPLHTFPRDTDSAGPATCWAKKRSFTGNGACCGYNWENSVARDASARRDDGRGWRWKRTVVYFFTAVTAFVKQFLNGRVYRNCGVDRSGPVALW